jgi:hypothetical protein
MYSSISLLYPRVFEQSLLPRDHTRTSDALPTDHAPPQAFQPSDIALSFFQDDGVAFLENLMDCNQSLECLDFVGEDGLAWNVSTSSPSNRGTYTFMPDQKDWEDLWSQV